MVEKNKFILKKLWLLILNRVLYILEPKGFFLNKRKNMQQIKNYLRGVTREFNLVKWPTKKTSWYFTLGVLVISIFFGIYIGLFDIFFAKILNIFVDMKTGLGFSSAVTDVVTGGHTKDVVDTVNNAVNPINIQATDINGTPINVDSITTNPVTNTVVDSANNTIDTAKTVTDSVKDTVKDAVSSTNSK